VNSPSFGFWFPLFFLGFLAYFFETIFMDLNTLPPRGEAWDHTPEQEIPGVMRTG